MKISRVPLYLGLATLMFVPALADDPSELRIECGAAMVGKAASCYRLARMYRQGEEVSRNASQALELFDRACKLDHAPGCVEAAKMHASGSGGRQSNQLAMGSLKRACELGRGLECKLQAVGEFVPLSWFYPLQRLLWIAVGLVALVIGVRLFAPRPPR